MVVKKRVKNAVFKFRSFYILFAISLSIFLLTYRTGDYVQKGRIYGSLDPRDGQGRYDWIREGKPDFCQSIMKNPAPCIYRGNDSVRCRDRPNGNIMFSSNHQDYFLYKTHFKSMGRAGVYVDLASNNPIKMSNTYFLDRCLGWRGICIEANDMYYEAIHRERSCSLVPTCVSSEDGIIIDFNMEHVKGGIVGDSYKFMKEINSTSDPKRSTKRIKQMKCSSMEKILSRYGVGHIDYLSLDIEGLELSVLESIDWENTIINLMTVEKGPRLKEIERFLSSKQYVRQTLDKSLPDFGLYKNFMGSDAVFTHKSVQFGSPK